jgi:hypothetical protein
MNNFNLQKVLGAVGIKFNPFNLMRACLKKLGSKIKYYKLIRMIRLRDLDGELLCLLQLVLYLDRLSKT